MSVIQRLVARLPFNFKKKALQILYLKSGCRLQDFRSFDNRFFAYKIENVFIPSESIGWFLTYDYYKNWVDSLSCHFYKPRIGDTIIDIGAGIGEEVIVFSEFVGQQGCVYSIEANPQVFHVLDEIINLNQLKNVRPYNFAVYSKNEVVQLENDHKTFLSGTIDKTQVEPQKNFFNVKGCRLDTFITENGIEKIDLLKVNIEGAERFVIDTLERDVNKIRNVAISCHDFRYRNEGGNEFYKTKEIVIDFLEKHDFELQFLNTGIEHKDDWVFGRNTKLQ
jgi:FkbM family methyltransferase